MQLIGKFDEVFGFLLCLIHVYSKCEWVVRLIDKKGIEITNAFQKILNESKKKFKWMQKRKPNKIWLDKGSEFYNRSMKLCLEKMI